MQQSIKHLKNLSHWNGKKPKGPQFTSAEYSRRSRLQSPNKYLHRVAKYRASKRGLDFDITPEDIIIPDYCPILGMKLEVGEGAGGKSTSPSLDRIDNTKGYVKGNVQVISNLANSMKSTATPEQLRKFAEWVLKNYGN